MILDDRGFESFMSWASRVPPLLRAYGTVVEPEREDKWREWGAALLLLPALSGQVTPSPYQYNDWRQWAADLNLSTNLAVG